VGGSKKVKHVANTSAEIKPPACTDSIVQPVRSYKSKRVADTSAETKPPAFADVAIEPANSIAAFAT